MNLFVIARNTCQDSIRNRVIIVFLALSVLLLTGGLGLRYMTATDGLGAYSPTLLFIPLVFSGLAALTISVFLMPNEIDRRTIYTVLSKPILRWEFFVGKYVGGVLAVGIVVGLMTLAMLVGSILFTLLPSPTDTSLTGGVGTVTEAPLALQIQYGIIGTLRGSLVIFFQMIVVVAIASTLSQFLTTTVNFALTAFLWIVGSLQWVISALANRNEQGLFVVPLLLKGLYYVTPHFNDLNIVGGFVTPEVPIKTGMAQFALLVGTHGLVYAAVAILVGVLVFERREV